MRPIFISLSTLAALAAPLGVQAAEPDPACAAARTPTGAFAAWISPTARTAATTEGAAAATRLQVGQATDLALHPIAGVKLPAPAGKPGGHGGLAAIRVAKAGTYRIALGTPAWIDVVADGKALASTAHGHGEPCTGIRKIVDFDLQPGRYVLAVSGSPDPRTRVLVVRRP